MREKYFSALQLSEILGIAAKSVRRIASKECWDFVEKKVNGGREKRFALSSLPLPIRARVEPLRSLEIKKNTPATELELEEYNRKRADARLKAVTLFEDYYLNHAEFTKWEAAEEFSKNWKNTASNELIQILPKFCPRSLFNWIAAYEQSGIIGLAPQYGNRKGDTKLAHEIKELILAAYLNQNKRSIRSIRSYIINEQALQEIGSENPILLAQRKRELGKELNIKLIERFIKHTVSSSLELKSRGVKHSREKVSVYLTRDPSSIPANYIWVSDGHDTNTRVFDEWGNPVRPVIVVWMDQHSRKIMGYSIGISEHTDLIIDSLLNGVEQYGRPEILYMDNGKAYVNKRTTEKVSSENRLKVYKMLGSQQMYAKPYNAREKSVEAFWRRFDNDFSKWLLGYTGASIEKRPQDAEKLVKSGRILDIETYREYVSHWILKYNTDPHTGMGMNGKSPEEVYATSIENPVFVDEETLTILRLRLVPEVRKIQAGGRVRLENREYTAPLLLRHIGETVELGLDRKNLSCAYVFKDGKLLAKAEAVIIADFKNSVQTEDARRQVSHMKSEEKKLNKQLLAVKTHKNKILMKDKLELEAQSTNRNHHLEDKKQIETIKNVFDY